MPRKKAGSCASETVDGGIARSTVVVGDFAIGQTPDSSQISIFHKSGEGGWFKTKKLEKAIRAFYDKEF
jgi:hypothetical protein